MFLVRYWILGEMKKRSLNLTTVMQKRKGNALVSRNCVIRESSQKLSKSAPRSTLTETNPLNMQRDTVVRMLSNLPCRKITEGTPVSLKCHFFLNRKDQKLIFFQI